MNARVLECQNCGRVMTTLGPEQAAKVARNPENYIVFCKICLNDKFEGEEVKWDG